MIDPPPLIRALGDPPHKGHRDTYKREKCVDCPPSQIPAKVYTCNDGQKRCIPHRAEMNRAFAQQLELSL